MARADGDDDENVSTTRPLSTGASQRACSLGATRGRCESGARVQRRQGLRRTKAEATPLVPRTVNHTVRELVEKRPPTTRHKVRDAVTTAEVKSPKLQTCDEQQPRGDWSHEPRDLDGRSGPEGVQTQWLGSLWNKSSPRERCPRGQRRRCLAQAVQAWTGLKQKKQPGKGPQDPRTKRATTAGKSGPTAGKKSKHSQLQANNEQSPFVSRPPRHRSLNKMTQALTIQTVLKDRKLSSHSSSRKPSRSLSQRRGRLNSENRGRIFITVQ